jgi:gamma-glutamyltranspeptidase/glutathione hydrolase
MLRMTSIAGIIAALTVLSWSGRPPVTEATSAQAPAGQTWQATGKNGAVSAGGQEAADAGLELLKAGGTAADAAAATTLVMTVMEHSLVCIGGEIPILYYDANRKLVEVFCGQGVAPRLATREYFAKKGGIPPKGVEPPSTPGTLDALLTLMDRHGNKTFEDVAQPALRILDRGKQAWHADCARTLRRLIGAEKASPGDRRRGLRFVADYFYRGPLAKELDAWFRANGGLIRYTDLATTVTRIEEPASAPYRGYTVYKCPAWTQGPYLLQTLRLLEGFDLKTMGANRSETIHHMVEAMKLALADRDIYYADPLFSAVPLKELLSDEYTNLRRPLIDPKRASLEQRPGDPRKMKALLARADFPVGPGAPDKDTTTCVVADTWGNVVAATPSGFNGVLAGKTGVWFGCRMQSFNTWEGHPNCIEPGKRPRITLTPGLVLKDGKPVLAVSSAGGDQQDQALCQLIINCLDFGMSPAQSVTQPRFGTAHHMSSFRQAPPVLGSLFLDPKHGEETIKELRDLGHKVTLLKAPWGRPVVVRFDHQSGTIEAAGDPRAGRNAAAY